MEFYANNRKEKSMIEKVLKTIQQYKLIENGDKLVLAVSGGPDSIAMLDILNKLRKDGKLQISNNNGDVLADINKDTEADENGNIAQITEDVVGPYELHDFFLYNMMRLSFEPKKIFYIANIAFKDKYDKKTIYKWLRNYYWRFFSQQFKRSCMPDGVKVGSISLSPRADWRMPSDANANLWLDEVNSL